MGLERLTKLAGRMLLGSTVTASEKNPLVHWAPTVAAMRRWVGHCWGKCGVHGHGEMYLAEMFMATDGLWFIGVVNYMNLVSDSLGNMRLRPEL